MDHYLHYQNYVSLAGMPWVSAGTVLATILIIAIVRSVSAYKTRQLFPAVDSGLTKSIYDAEPLYREGYRKFKNTPYRVTTADGDHLMIPNALFDDFYRVLDKDPDAADLAQRVSLEVKHTGLEVLPLLKQTLHNDMPRNLTRIHPILVGAVNDAIKTELLAAGSKTADGQWTNLLIDQAIGRMIAIISGTVFMGAELARRDEWLDAAANYTGTGFYALFLIKMWPKPLRNIASLFNLKLRSLRKQRRKALDFLVPIIQQRRSLMNSGEKVPDDMLRWMLSKGEEIPDSLVDEKVAGQLLQLTLVAIHTTSLTTTFLFYDLLLHGAAVIDDIRAEIKAVLRDNGGLLSPQALAQMKLLDSAIKESQRMHPLGLSKILTQLPLRRQSGDETDAVFEAKYTRYVQQPFKISTGQTIPAGSVVEVPFIATLRDPKLYIDPEVRKYYDLGCRKVIPADEAILQKFDPYRFQKIRSGERPDPLQYKVKDQHQFVAATRENLSWGWGRHACPGRFFAAHEIKLIAAEILLNYDLKLPEGMTAEKAQDYFTPKELFVRPRIDKAEEAH